MAKRYHLTAPDAGRMGRRTTLDLMEFQAETIHRDLSTFLSGEASGPCHLTIFQHNRNPLTLTLDRQNAEFAHSALSNVMSRDDERAPSKTLGYINVNVTP